MVARFQICDGSIYYVGDLSSTFPFLNVDEPCSDSSDKFWSVLSRTISIECITGVDGILVVELHTGDWSSVRVSEMSFN